jgi:GxxExxY protein
MDTNKIICRDEVYGVVRSAIEVLNGMVHGFHEKPYENALTVEFGLCGIPFEQQVRFDVIYKGVKVGDYIPDLIAWGRVVIDTKVIERITHHERGRMINYLRITRLPVGLILNFKHPKLEWERVVGPYAPFENRSRKSTDGGRAPRGRRP